MVALADKKSAEVDKSILKRLVSYWYIKKGEEGYIPGIMVMRRNKSHEMPMEFREQFGTLRYKARDIAT